MSQEHEVIAAICDSSDIDIIRVLRDKNGVYHVENQGVIRHPDCSAEDAMRALANYAQSFKFDLDRVKGYD